MSPKIELVKRQWLTFLLLWNSSITHLLPKVLHWQINLCPFSGCQHNNSWTEYLEDRKLSSLAFDVDLFYVYVCFGSMYVCILCIYLMSVEDREGHQIPRGWSYRWLWGHDMGAGTWIQVPCINSNVLKHRTISPTSVCFTLIFFWILIFYKSLSYF